MPQLLHLEGRDPHELLVRARGEYGPEVSVVRAERVRTGGLLGFFARETFELTLQVPEGAVPAAASPTGPPAGAAVPDALRAALDAEIADAAAARAEMIASASSQAAATDFSRELAEAAAEHVPPHREFVPASFPAAEPAAVVVGRADAVAPAPPVSPEETVEHGTEASLAAEAAVVAEPRPVEADTPRAGVVLHPWGVTRDLVQVVTEGPTVTELLALGVPARLMGPQHGLESRVPLIEMVARLGATSPARPEPGDVIVVAGPPARALQVAGQVATWMDMPVTSVILAGEFEPIRGHGRRVRTEAAARAVRRRAEESAREGLPIIVALGVVPGRRGAREAAPLIAAIEADSTWAVVDASSRGAAFDGGLAALQSVAAIDAVAAVGLARAQAPAALLDASVPIAWMDGLPASPVVWAALLAERVASPV
jgi:hypothetical protein